MGKNGSALDIVAPSGSKLSRLLILGSARCATLKSRISSSSRIANGQDSGRGERCHDHRRFPGGASSRSGSPTSRSACGGLRAYAFERYKTKRKDGEKKAAEVKVTIATAALRRWKRHSPRAAPWADGVAIARDLVNEPAKSFTGRIRPIAPRSEEKLGSRSRCSTSMR